MRSLLVSLGVVLVLATGYEAVARTVAALDAKRAWRIAPTEIGAGQALAVEMLVEGRTDEARPVAEALVRTAPVRARSWSLLAEIDAAAGAEADARRLTEAVLMLKPTDMLSMLRHLAWSIRDGDTMDAMVAFDIFLRRHTGQATLATGILKPMLAGERGYGLFVQALSLDPPWSVSAMRALREVGGEMELLYRIERDLLAGGHRSRSLEETIGTLQRSERPDLAYRLFLASHDEAEGTLSGYVHDAAFVREPGGGAYTWELLRSAGVDLQWIEGAAATGNEALDGLRIDTDERAGDDGGTLRVHFTDHPVRSIGLGQAVSLPKGRYVFRTRVSARDLVAPKGVAWELRCKGVANETFAVALEGGTYERREFQQPFTLVRPCPSGRLQLVPEERTSSFRFRYTGILDVHEAAIEWDEG